MATNAANLETIKSNLLAKLAEVTANPKPSYSINGQSVSWTDYYNSLFSQVEKVNALIVSEADPFEITSEAH